MNGFNYLLINEIFYFFYRPGRKIVCSGNDQPVFCLKIQHRPYKFSYKPNTFNFTFFDSALYLNNYTNQYDFKINGNYMSTSSTGTPYGIMMYYASGSFEMKNNTVIQTNSGYGIYHYYSYGSATNRHVIANNVVVIGGANTYNYCMYMYYATFTDIINNSFHFYGTGTTNGKSCC